MFYFLSYVRKFVSSAGYSYICLCVCSHAHRHECVACGCESVFDVDVSFSCSWGLLLQYATATGKVPDFLILLSVLSRPPLVCRAVTTGFNIRYLG